MITILPDENQNKRKDRSDESDDIIQPVTKKLKNVPSSNEIKMYKITDIVSILSNSPYERLKGYYIYCTADVFDNIRKGTTKYKYHRILRYNSTTKKFYKERFITEKYNIREKISIIQQKTHTILDIDTFFNDMHTVEFNDTIYLMADTDLRNFKSSLINTDIDNHIRRYLRYCDDELEEVIVLTH